MSSPAQQESKWPHKELGRACQTILQCSELTTSIVTVSGRFAAFFLRTFKSSAAFGLVCSVEGNSLFVKHRKQHTPAPHLGACGLKHQCGALSSMLSFMKSSISSLSAVLGSLPLVSSPPERDANATTILLSLLLSTFLVRIM